MAKFSLFQRIKEGFTGLIKGLKGELNAPIPKPQASEEVEHIRQQEIKWQSEYDTKISKLNEKYKPLFNLAQAKYEALENTGSSGYSSAYQNAGGDFKDLEIKDMGTMFREVARAQTFVKDPTSNIEVVKEEMENKGINIYVGRGKGEEDLKDFWSAVNRAKETSDIREKIVQKQYSGAFEYAYKIWKETPEANDETVLDALNKFLDIETETRAQDFMTPTALKYEISEDTGDDDYYM